MVPSGEQQKAESPQRLLPFLKQVPLVQ